MLRNNPEMQNRSVLSKLPLGIIAGWLQEFLNINMELLDYYKPYNLGVTLIDIDKDNENFAKPLYEFDIQLNSIYLPQNTILQTPFLNTPLIKILNRSNKGSKWYTVKLLTDDPIGNFKESFLPESVFTILNIELCSTHLQ